MSRYPCSEIFKIPCKTQNSKVCQSVFALETNRCIPKKNAKSRKNTLTAELLKFTEIQQSSSIFVFTTLHAAPDDPFHLTLTKNTQCSTNNGLSRTTHGPPIKDSRRSWMATPYQVRAGKLDGHPLSSTDGEAGWPTPYQVLTEF